MHDRRRFLLASLAVVAASSRRAAAATMPDDIADVGQLGTFERVPGRPGIVVGVPHGTPDTGTLDTGRILCERLGLSGVFVTGFWDSKTRHRVNVNRDSEEIIGPASEVVREWQSPRAVAANARYNALVKEAAQGPLKVFYELHSNHRPDLTSTIAVSTQGLWISEAKRFRNAFDAAVERLDPQVPRLAMRISPLDKVTYPVYVRASSIARLSAKGCAIESPGRVLERRPWRIAYAQCLAEAIGAAGWS